MKILNIGLALSITIETLNEFEKYYENNEEDEKRFSDWTLGEDALKSKELVEQ